MRFVSRLLVILWTVWRFGLDDLALSGLFWAVIGFVLGVLLAWLTARFLGIGL